MKVINYSTVIKGEGQSGYVLARFTDHGEAIKFMKGFAIENGCPEEDCRDATWCIQMKTMQLFCYCGRTMLIYETLDDYINTMGKAKVIGIGLNEKGMEELRRGKGLEELDITEQVIRKLDSGNEDLTQEHTEPCEK